MFWDYYYNSGEKPSLTTTIISFAILGGLLVGAIIFNHFSEKKKKF